MVARRPPPSSPDRYDPAPLSRADPPATADQAGKAELRRRIRDRRARSLPPAGPLGDPDGDRLADALIALPEVSAPGSRVASYVSGPTEPSTRRLNEWLRGHGRPALLPVLRPDLDLDWALDDGGRRPGAVRPALVEPTTPRRGAAAVAEATVVVVPALAVSRDGTRLGQGGGSYDRALARVPADVLVVALLHPGELVDVLPSEPHDRPVDAVVSVDGVERLRSRPAPAAGSAPRPTPPPRA